MHVIEHRGSEAFWRQNEVTPKESPLNAERLSFPLQLVLTVMGMLLALVVGYFSGQSQWKSEMSGLRSDVRDGFTMLQGDRKADEVRMDVIRRDLDDVMKDVKLLKIQRTEDHDEVILMKRSH